METQTQERSRFRFNSKKEYERELSRLISLKNSISPKRPKAGPRVETVEEEYDRLMEEYLSFCSSERDV